LDAVAKLRRGDRLGVVLPDPRLRLHHLGQRPVADAVAVREGAPLPPERQLAAEIREQLCDEPRLSDSRDADDRDELRLALPPGTLERPEHLVELPTAADEREKGVLLDVAAEA